MSIEPCRIHHWVGSWWQAGWLLLTSYTPSHTITHSRTHTHTLSLSCSFTLPPWHHLSSSHLNTISHPPTLIPSLILFQCALSPWHPLSTFTLLSPFLILFQTLTPSRILSHPLHSAFFCILAASLNIYLKVCCFSWQNENLLVPLLLSYHSADNIFLFTPRFPSLAANQLV